MLNLRSLLSRPWFCSVLSVLLLSMPWFGFGGWSLFFCWVPMLYLHGVMQESGKGGFLWWIGGVIFCWYGLCCYWVSYSTILASVGIPLTLLVLLWPCWWLFVRVYRVSGGGVLPYLVLCCGWVVAEWWSGSGEVNFPWLLMGNGWSGSVWGVQWYSVLGVSGGSFWLILSNVLWYRALRVGVGGLWWAVGVSFVPLLVSGLMFLGDGEQSDERLRVCVIQPNVDAYEKFSSVGAVAQLESILELAGGAPADTELYLAPETALVRGVNIGRWESNSDLLMIRSFLAGRGGVGTFIIGASTYEAGVHYNSACVVDSSGVRFYHKRRLVTSVETTPGWMQWLIGVVDLGGFAGSLGRGDGPLVVDVGRGDVGVGTAICYESVYAELFSGWVAGGAGVMAIITNDGWWGDTHGHRQHMDYARLRAIENRRWVVRSANTGISGVVSPRGEVVESLGWDVRGSIVYDVPVLSDRTFFSVWGDMTTRLCGFVLALCVLYSLSRYYRAKQP